MRAALLFSLLLVQSYVNTAQVSIEQIALKPGSFTAGFVHYITFDSTRTYNRIFDWTTAYTFRPIPVSVWYPSDEKPITPPITVLDYMKILKEEEEWEQLPDEQILNWFYYPNTQSNQNHLRTPTAAFTQIEPANGEYPVVIYAPSYQASSIENFALCEYLASYGYVVISSPSRGTVNRFLEGGTEKDMETQARDIEFLLAESHRLTNADPGKIATMGFSFGGLSQVLAQMRDARIKAMVSLDGSVKYQYQTLKNSAFHKIENVTVPFIHFSQKEIPSQVLIEDEMDSSLNAEFEFFDNLQFSDAYHYQFHDLTHSYFSSLGILFQPRDQRQDKSDAEIIESYHWVSIYTRNFLDAYLKKEVSALGFLNREPTENIKKPDLASKEVNFPMSRNFTFQDFNDVAQEQNYLNLKTLYDSLTKEYPELNLPEANLNNLGLQLVFTSQKTSMGINVLLLATILYPESANLWDSLAEGYLFSGNEQAAIANFKKSLELYPGNQNAIKRLQELE